ncbi:efflux RND transporter periplasmic adaptor subunit [Shewanella sp. WXL01]|uniref:Efflux RND transporter periplasmic adaptor subunit n=1 Tax=Shewanella maritima TaxID=2520507 RepID=A0A411PJG4_9GAMM|nr:MULTISPECIES: efflux RND transporter periplasmic adaptor subunit [Shewanella]NKF51423.1 efflux RND transporter periplasmic adaptor subunit [Shewanella sp. WXL01]QBF83675.1 efflux RND transporter periplasmic adaptor subunit [Shewanella maritima]
MLKKLFRFLLPFLIIFVFVALAGILLSTKQEPEKKQETTVLPVVEVISVEPQTVSLNLPSYGVVQPKHKTQLVTEVQGRILEIAPAFVAGGIVKKGQKLALLEPSDYQADLMQAQAGLAQAKAILDEEIARGEVAKIEFKDFDGGVAPELGLRIPQLKKEQANVKSAQAALSRAQRNLDRTVIRAPFDGIIKARSVDLGQYITVGTKLGELYDIGIAEVRLPLPNKDLAYLESIEKPETTVTLTASLAGKQVSWLGKIVRNENVVDEQNRMVYLVAEVNDPYMQQESDIRKLPLKYGSFVNAVIKGRSVDGIVKLPRYVVRDDSVTIIKDDNTVELRDVNIVRTDVDNVYIKGSLKVGERVSVSSNNSLQNGQQVKVLGEEGPEELIEQVAEDDAAITQSDTKEEQGND